MIWLLLAIAVHPPMVDITGFPGQEVQIPLTLVGKGTVHIEGTGLLSVEETISVEGKKEYVVSQNIPASTKPGKYKSYLYVAEESDDPVLTAAAITVETLVHESAPATIVEGTEKTFQRFPLAIALGVLAFSALLVGFFVWKHYANGGSLWRSSKSVRHNPQE